MFSAPELPFANEDDVWRTGAGNAGRGIAISQVVPERVQIRRTCNRLDQQNKWLNHNSNEASEWQTDRSNVGKLWGVEIVK